MYNVQFTCIAIHYKVRFIFGLMGTNTIHINKIFSLTIPQTTLMNTCYL